MSKVVKFAALQLTKSWDLEDNLAKAKKAIREAAQNGANVILPQELFAAPYFCKKQEAKYFELAEEIADAAKNDEERQLARHVFALAGALDPRHLGRSACLALAQLEDQPTARARLLALASLLSQTGGSVTLRTYGGHMPEASSPDLPGPQPCGWSFGGVGRVLCCATKRQMRPMKRLMPSTPASDQSSVFSGGEANSEKSRAASAP